MRAVNPIISPRIRTLATPLAEGGEAEELTKTPKHKPPAKPTPRFPQSPNMKDRYDCKQSQKDPRGDLGGEECPEVEIRVAVGLEDCHLIRFLLVNSLLG